MYTQYTTQIILITTLYFYHKNHKLARAPSPAVTKRNQATICLDDSRNHIIRDYYYDYNSLALLYSNAQSSCQYAQAQ